MNQILGKTKSVKELLTGVKYSIEYYQREYKWQQPQIRELIDDLSSRFLTSYQPGDTLAKIDEYSHYFLGSIILTQKSNKTFIVDGQQRLTSVTLLLIYLRHLQENYEKKAPIDNLIFSDAYGEKSFNLQIPERELFMQKLFDHGSFEENNENEAIRNLIARYKDIEHFFPNEIKEEGISHFSYWLMEKVYLVEINTFSDDDAYTVFETMNDRGLSLTPSEMLKGYLLSRIENDSHRTKANEQWKETIHTLNIKGREAQKEIAADFFKAWIRSQYANSIRERKKDATAQDFDRIGTEFHRWIRENSENIDLEHSDDFVKLIDHNLDFYSKLYLQLIEASLNLISGLESVRYNADHGFTLQYMLMLSPISPTDDQTTVNLKFALVSQFIDILLVRRLWNYRSTTYSTMSYHVFGLMKQIRHLSVEQLKDKLVQTLNEQEETFNTDEYLYMHQQNRRSIHRILARIISYIEKGSNLVSRYTEYVNDSVKDRYEIEHIWANHPERYTDEFHHPVDFQGYRNVIGGLLLLPKSFNASYGDSTFEEKLPHYNSQNILARSLNPQCYESHPGFLDFVDSSNLPFTKHQEFKKKDIDARSELYRQIAKQIWNPNNLLNISDSKEQT